jgi:TonB family protein
MILTLATVGVGVLTLFSFVPNSGGPLTALAEENVAEEAKVTPPRPIGESMVYPEFPKEARLLPDGGKVLLKARISATGEVTEVTEVSGIEGCAKCTENAVVALRQWRFEPATSDGVPTALEVVGPFMYALEGKDEGDQNASPSDGTNQDATGK